MTYAEFLVIFLIVPTIVLVGVIEWLGRRDGAQKTGRKYHRLGVSILTLIAFIWTTPWDNYLIATGVWDSPADRIFFRVGYVPIEEYAFFVLMPIFNGAIIFLLLNYSGLSVAKSTWRTKQTKQRIALFLGGIFLQLGGWWLLRDPRGAYLGLILVWFTPPLMVQWLFDPTALLRGKWFVVFGTLLPLLYFALADRFAITQGIWEVSERHTIGYGLPNLPLEEIVFFGVTSLLLAQGLVLWHSINPSKQAA